MSSLYSLLFTIIVSASLNGCGSSSGEGESSRFDQGKVQEGTAVATFAGGCFWCTEAVFERVKGVEDVVSGYTGGAQQNPTYQQVSYGNTDHAEAVQIYYDPAVISYRELLEIFFATHDPTQLNRQGPDVGKQYRTAVFYHDEEQQASVSAYIKKLDGSGKYPKPVVTEVSPYEKFWLAEKYHQDYYELNPGNPYIINIAVPKVKKFKEYFPDKVKTRYKNE